VVNNLTSNATLTPQYPAGYTAEAGDYCFICLYGALSNVPPNIGLASGYAKATTNPIYDNSTGAFSWFFYKKLTAAEASPSFSSGTDASGGLGVFLMIVRGLDGTTVLDVTPTGTGPGDAASTTKVGPSITPVTPGAFIVHLACTNGTPALSLSSANGFTLERFGTTSVGNDFGHALAYRIADSAGLVTGPTFAANPTKDWSIQCLALRPAT